MKEEKNKRKEGSREEGENLGSEGQFWEIILAFEAIST